MSLSMEVDVKDISALSINLSKTSLTINNWKSFNAKSYLNSAIDNKGWKCHFKEKISGSVNTSKAGKYSDYVNITTIRLEILASIKTLSVKVESPIPTNAGAAASALSKTLKLLLKVEVVQNAFVCI